MQHGGDTIHCDDLPWLPLAPNVTIKIIKTAPVSGAYSVMIHAEPGGVLPRHQHLADAEIFILKGSGVHPQTGAYTRGDYVSEREGAVHDELLFTEETELLMVSSGPSAFLDPAGGVMFMMNVEMLEGMRAQAAA